VFAEDARVEAQPLLAGEGVRGAAEAIDLAADLVGGARRRAFDSS
jgi:hypothetical protein